MIEFKIQISETSDGQTVRVLLPQPDLRGSPREAYAYGYISGCVLVERGAAAALGLEIELDETPQPNEAPAGIEK